MAIFFTARFLLLMSPKMAILLHVLHKTQIRFKDKKCLFVFFFFSTFLAQNRKNQKLERELLRL